MQATVFAVALSSGLGAGVFYAFSSFVMAGLSRLPPAQGISAMQSINRTALRPSLLVPLIGTGLAHLGLGGWLVSSWGDRAAGWVLAGAVVYVLGTMVVTITRNVPKNEALAKLDAGDPDAAPQWVSYVSSWTAWNHVRVLSSLAASALLTAALIQS